jgi:hypothetical protein
MQLKHRTVAVAPVASYWPSDGRLIHILQKRAHRVELRAEARPVSRFQALDGLMVAVERLPRPICRGARKRRSHCSARGRRRDAGFITSPSSVAVSGVSSDGLTTMVLPQASAGPTFQVISSSGRFQGETNGRTRQCRLQRLLSVKGRVHSFWTR